MMEVKNQHTDGKLRRLTDVVWMWPGARCWEVKRLVSYLEVKDDGPDEPKGELGVAIHNVLSSDVDKFDLFVT